MGNMSKSTPSRTRKINGRSRKMKALVTKKRIKNVSINGSYHTKAQQSSNEESKVEVNVTMKSNDSVSSDLSDLEMEVETKKTPIMQDSVYGRRIVNLPHILDQYKNIVLHKLKCTNGEMKFVKEVRSGLFTVLHFYCDTCEKSSAITSDPIKDEINTAMAWGCLSSGIGHYQCEEIFGVINVPIMTAKTFTRKTSIIKKTWQDHLTEKMREAGEAERRIALEKGHISPCGVPFITVVGDGGWSKRSYGHGYNASSGVGVIIGVETKMPLFLGVRNKVCALCNFYKKNQREIPKHECAMNFKGPSTSMEQDIIVEGFKCSIEQHGLIYKYYIGDGDSSVYTRIVERVSYGREVQKIECANHMIRGLNDKLHKIGCNTQYPLDLRKLLTSKVDKISRIERLVRGIRTAIKMASQTGAEPSVLRYDIANAVNHVFGRHLNCRDTFCKKKNEEDFVFRIENHPIHEAILKAIDPLVQKADRIVFNQTTNYAERYMALVAKCVGGKRINFTGRLSYTARAQAAGLAHMSGPVWHLDSWKYFSKKDPGTIMTTVFKRRLKPGKVSKKQRKFRTVSNGPDADYGPDAATPDISEHELAEASQKFLNTLRERADNRRDWVEMNTRGQHDNQLWRELRRNYLTASNFGAVIKRRRNTPCHNLVKSMLYSREINTAAISYGRLHETEAIQKYCTLRNVQVQNCGLYLSKNFPFLGASPDGLITGDDGIVEVKCLLAIGNRKIIESASGKTCFEVIDNEIMLKKQHNYFFQIQGQLAITEKSFCDLILFSSNDFHVERIYRDEDLWKEKMIPKLEAFYLNCMLPEIINPRLPRGMRIRDLNSTGNT